MTKLDQKEKDKMLKLDSVSKKYSLSGEGVENINLEIYKGEFISLLGPSGCGKTTTLRLIAGLEKVDNGRIFLEDIEITNVPPQYRHVALVFQNYALFPHFSVRDNIAFGLKVKGVDNYEIYKRVKEISQLLKIENLLDRKPKELSGGQRQRVALGRALVVKPKVLLLDEPLSNLDTTLRNYMITELKMLHKKMGTTTIYVTHNQLEAMSMSDKIAVMNFGQIVQLAPPKDLIERPKNRFVAEFVGEPKINTFVGELFEIKDKILSFNIGKQIINITIEDEQKIEILKRYLNKNLILGIRPIYISFREEEGVDSYFTINGTVEVTEYYNNFNLVIVNVDDEFELYVQVDENEEIQEGENIKCFINTRKLLFFDYETEENIFFSIN